MDHLDATKHPPIISVVAIDCLSHGPCVLFVVCGLFCLLLSFFVVQKVGTIGVESWYPVYVGIFQKFNFFVPRARRPLYVELVPEPENGQLGTMPYFLNSKISTYLCS